MKPQTVGIICLVAGTLVGFLASFTDRDFAGANALLLAGIGWSILGSRKEDL